MPRAVRRSRIAFSSEEAKALVAAVRLAQDSLPPHLAASARRALSKLLAASPGKARAEIAARQPGKVPPRAAAAPACLAALQLACEQHRKARLVYRDTADEPSAEHTLRPLGCHQWGDVWMLNAWCESHAQFHTLRIDRIEAVDTLAESFADEPGRTLDDLFRQLEAEMAERDSAIDA